MISSDLGLVGNSQAIARARDELRRCADLPFPLLITGERGTGKDLAAKAVHTQSCRHRAPFVRVSAAALTDSLAASQLFGHRRGAFTGAVGNHPGLLREVRSGTLFLDEVAELETTVQAKLLTVLGCEEFAALGAATQQQFTGRLVCATNVDLGAAVQAGRFRADLLDRVAVLVVHMPPLRERREDVLTIAVTLLARLCAKAQRPVLQLDMRARSRLMVQDWPGNVRELHNVMARALAWANDGVISGAVVARALEQGGAACAERAAPQPSSASDLAVLLANVGSLRQLAVVTGISKSALQRRLTARSRDGAS